jgi:DNA-binding MarR family transcriptional regulator
MSISADELSSPRPYFAILLRLLHQEHAQAVDRALRAVGFTDIRPPHASVFPFVPPEGIQVSEIARLARVRKQTTAQAVEQLERAGYVERRPDPSDGRAQLVFLTEKGTSVRPIAIAAGRRVEERWAELIGAEDLESLRALLQRLLGRLSESPHEEDPEFP